MRALVLHDTSLFAVVQCLSKLGIDEHDFLKVIGANSGRKDSRKAWFKLQPGA
jgi:hypothetical protein